MKLSSASCNMPDCERKIIRRNLIAFEHNFGEIILLRYKDGSFDVFLDYDAYLGGRYIQRCRNIDYLDGWLYGVVQGGIVRAKQNERGV